LPEKLRDGLGAFVALALGFIGFLVLIGWTTLIPTNIGWLDFQDWAQHTLGWMFFRETMWGNPPGLSPDLGLELSNSIGLVDGLPLFAIPLKLVSAWLPQPFQYWGYWLLISFLLQALFAYLIAREMQAGRLIALVAAAFVLITPAYMFRIQMHLALSGHWTILAALYLYIRKNSPPLWWWPLLVTLTAGIHAYLLAMVVALWFAASAERLLSKRLTAFEAMIELLAGLAMALAVLWTSGFFLAATLGTHGGTLGYGDFKLNLLWPLLTFKGWTQIVPDLPHTKYDYEGFSFLGIGILALLVLSIASGALSQLRAALTRRWWPLALALIGLMLFALSKSVHFADIQLLKLSLPQTLENLASMFRSTGRFVWPLLYFITIGVVVMISRRLPVWFALPLVLVAFGAQVADSAPALMAFANRLAPVSDNWDTPLVSPFWQRAAKAGLKKVRVIPVVSNPGTDWKALGYYAVIHHMGIDSVYLGRVDADALAALRDRETEVLKTGNFDPDTLYILDPPSALEAQAHLTSSDLFSFVDHRIVVVKNGAHLGDGLDLAPPF
jgi:hypothetical protein